MSSELEEFENEIRNNRLKLLKEVEYMSLPFWKKHEYLRALVPIVITTGGIIVGILSGFFDNQKRALVNEITSLQFSSDSLENNIKLMQMENSKIQLQNAKLSDSLTLVADNIFSMESRINNLSTQIKKERDKSLKLEGRFEEIPDNYVTFSKNLSNSSDQLEESVKEIKTISNDVRTTLGPVQKDISIKGRVVDHKTNMPIEFAMVTLKFRNGREDIVLFATKNGFFQGILPKEENPGRVEVIVESGDYNKNRRSISSITNRELDIRLWKGNLEDYK